MGKHRNLALNIILISLILISCSAQANIELPTPTLKLVSTETYTPAPTNTETTVPTVTPSPVPACNAVDVLKNIKANIPYKEFEVYFNTIEGLTFLTIWYVDPEIDPDSSSEDVDQNAMIAMRNAAITSLQLTQLDSCIADLFDAVNPIVVDSNYNGWFSAQVDPNNLPDSDDPSESELSSIEASFVIGYSRENVPVPLPPAPTGSCTWQETRTKIQQHFSAERENVMFSFVIDDVGTNVWAQWDGPTGFLATVSILNIAMELDCLHPSPTQLIMIVVNEQGKVGMIAILPEIGIETLDLIQMQTLYQE
ncbi:MAG TPA: hypothetical protein VLA72_20130 [Anaerolineales bacterium]|nr:hypothetical protein [Anaerolineales bacterium]